MNTSVQAGGSHPDLLSSIMGVTIRNEEKIAAEDREFCEERQAKLYATLHQLKWWYDLFVANAERYRESRNLVCEENGSIKKYNLRNVYHNEGRDDYVAFEFIPVESINEVVKLYGRAVSSFANDIVRHFNGKYGVSVPRPDIDDEKLPMGFIPTYQPYVDMVISHLSGKGFREVAEEELIARFHYMVTGYRDKLKAVLKSDRIVFSDLLYFDSFYLELTYKTNHLHSNCIDKLTAICEGIGFGAAEALNGSIDNILYFRSSDVDITEWYEFDICDGITFKFYKNGRLDVKFKDTGAAERCWKKLRLDTFKNTDGDE